MTKNENENNKVFFLQIKVSFVFLLYTFCLLPANADEKSKNLNSTVKISTTESPSSCICGIFLSGQFKKGSKEQPTGNPALIHDQPGSFPCTALGNRLCVNKCLDTVSQFIEILHNY